MKRLTALFTALLSGCADLCSNEPIDAMASPDNALEAVVFERHCGATTGYATQVSIIQTGDKLPNEAGNVLSVEGQPSLELEWITPKQLLISGLTTTKPVNLHNKVDDVTISVDR
ncbi:hypothetical protein [Marinobacter sp. JSM 1782161]|uniref:hypothetical protein n=1 Tax=Marinobacter sp. JSM 1782161 TaxID=2685906 RepID=UPI001402BEC9|nr:hypothetical protein [Marinobacter sp. JSM 1782161]